jgi:glycine oxidase
MTEEIVIVGGGICGLSIGWFLARSGHPVTLLERGGAGLGATWAAAGMLAPYAEAEPGEEGSKPSGAPGGACGSTRRSPGS